MRIYQTLQDAANNDAIVNAYRGDLEGCVIALANQKQILGARLIELESICPKKHRLPNGKVVVYHTPDEPIPTQDCSPP